MMVLGPSNLQLAALRVHPPSALLPSLWAALAGQLALASAPPLPQSLLHVGRIQAAGARAAGLVSSSPGSACPPVPGGSTCQLEAAASTPTGAGAGAGARATCAPPMPAAAAAAAAAVAALGGAVRPAPPLQQAQPAASRWLQLWSRRGAGGRQQQRGAGASWHHRPRPFSTTSTASGATAGEDIPEGRGHTVAVGISGGVDSAVAAMLLKERGYNVVGVFMRNWDEGEEVGNQNCSVERDLRDASAVCRQLGVPLHEADFVSQYWTQVFEGFLEQCSRGLTPNPDLACNRHIKFDALLQFADQLGAPLVATGHYARLCRLPASPTPAGAAGAAGPAGAAGDQDVQLLRGSDHHKDQSYFLASVRREALQRVLFPVGSLRKAAVRQLAAERGLLPAERRSSTGICFIGRRNFADFLSQYIPPLPGTYVSLDTGVTLGSCPNILAVTHGQRPGIGGAAGRLYVAGKDVVNRVVYVCQGHDHPALLTRTALLRAPHWLSPAHQERLAIEGHLRCQYKARYGQEPRACTLYPVAAWCQQASVAGSAGAEGFGGATAGGISAAAALPGMASAFQPSAYTRLQPLDQGARPGYLVAQFGRPEWGVTPQQAFVAYDGEVCLGSALIAGPGLTLAEEEEAEEGCLLPLSS